jgi:hypothetical protein
LSWTLSSTTTAGTELIALRPNHWSSQAVAPPTPLSITHGASRCRDAPEVETSKHNEVDDVEAIAKEGSSDTEEGGGTTEKDDSDIEEGGGGGIGEGGGDDLEEGGGGDLEEKEVTSSQKLLDMDQVKDLVFLSILWMTI